MSGRCARSCSFGCRRGHNRRRAKTRCRLMLVEISGSGVRRGRPQGLEERVITSCACSWSAEGHPADGLGEVSAHYPQPLSTRPRSSRCRRSYTVSAETVSNCAVRWTSRTSGQRPAAGAVGRGEGRDGGGIASSRLKTRWQAVEEHSRKCLYLFQQNPNFLEIIPNIPEVLTGTTAHYRPHGGPLPHGHRLPAGVLIRKMCFVAQCWWEAGLTEIFA